MIVIGKESISHACFMGVRRYDESYRVVHDEALESLRIERYNQQTE